MELWFRSHGCGRLPPSIGHSHDPLPCSSCLSTVTVDEAIQAKLAGSRSNKSLTEESSCSKEGGHMASWHGVRPRVSGVQITCSKTFSMDADTKKGKTPCQLGRAHSTTQRSPARTATQLTQLDLTPHQSRRSTSLIYISQLSEF